MFIFDSAFSLWYWHFILIFPPKCRWTISDTTTSTSTHMRQFIVGSPITINCPLAIGRFPSNTKMKPSRDMSSSNQLTNSKGGWHLWMTNLPESWMLGQFGQVLPPRIPSSSNPCKGNSFSILIWMTTMTLEPVAKVKSVAKTAGSSWSSPKKSSPEPFLKTLASPSSCTSTPVVEVCTSGSAMKKPGQCTIVSENRLLTTSKLLQEMTKQPLFWQKAIPCQSFPRKFTGSQIWRTAIQ